MGETSGTHGRDEKYGSKTWREDTTRKT